MQQWVADVVHKAIRVLNDPKSTASQRTVARLDLEMWGGEMNVILQTIAILALVASSIVW